MSGEVSGWAIAALWLYSTFVIFWGVQWWLGRHIQGLGLLVFGRPGPAATIYFYLLAPGVMLHELSHWLFAKLLFVPTKDVVLFRPHRGRPGSAASGPVTLGYVEIFKTDPVRQSIIGLAPLPVGIVVLLVLAALLNFNTGVGGAVRNDNIWQAISALPAELLASLRQPLNLLWLYLVFTVSNGMLPSRPDRRPWLIGFILPGSLLLALGLTGWLPPFPLAWQQGLRQWMGNLTWIFAFAATINLVLALITYALEIAISRLKRRRVVYK